MRNVIKTIKNKSEASPNRILYWPCKILARTKINRKIKTIIEEVVNINSRLKVKQEERQITIVRILKVGKDNMEINS